MILRSFQGCSWIKLYIMSTFPSPSRPKDKSIAQLPYDPGEYPRENSRHYISATSEDIASMLGTVKVGKIV